MLLYPVVDRNRELGGSGEVEERVTFGFAFHLPLNSHHGTLARFGVRDASKKDDIVVGS